MTATYVGHTQPTTTDYRPHPESTDSEFNGLQQAYARLRRYIAELEVENASLRDHLDADHRQLQSLSGVTGLIDHHRQIAADDGPEVVYDWSQDEDAVEYNYPAKPPRVVRGVPL